MEFYCNTNFYGNHCYGVQAASRYYFGKDAADLETWEAAVLVGLSNSLLPMIPSAIPMILWKNETTYSRVCMKSST